MSENAPQPPVPPGPTIRDFEAVLSRVSQVIRSHTNAIRLVDAKEVSNARTLGELQAICTSLRDSSATGAERLADKLDLLVDLARDSRSDMRQALSELRAANDKLGVQRDEIKNLLMSDRYTPTHVPLLPRDPPPPPDEPDGITISHGKVRASFGVMTAWNGAKKHSGWISTGVVAVWHFAGDHVVTAFRALWNFLGH